MSRYFVSCECGGRGELFIRPITEPVFCDACGAQLKAEEHPIKYDGVRYRIRITAGDPADIEQIKAVAATANCNYVQARTIVAKGDGQVFEGRAFDVWAKRIEFEALGLGVAIEPKFPWA